MSSPAFAADIKPAQPKPEGILDFAISAETPNYDCHAQDSYAAILFLVPFSSTLLQVDLPNYPKIRGDLAESWQVSPDNLKYTLKLRPGVTFHDGCPLTSTDIKATYERLQDPPIGVFSARKAAFESIDRIETPDPLTVVFRAKAVDNGLLTQFASPWNYIYSAALLSENINAPETKINDTGHFKFVKHKRGGYVSGARNEKYFVACQPYLEGYKGHFLL